MLDKANKLYEGHGVTFILTFSFVVFVTVIFLCQLPKDDTFILFKALD